MTKLLIIADDLTGANDVGAQFSKQGIPALVHTDMSSSLDSFVDYQVIVVNTESRHLESFTAATRVSDVVARGVRAGATHFYKKTDSTLRGNIGSELELFMRATGCNRLPFIPAFPKLKRTTRNGFHYVLDQQLHASAFTCDPLEPVTESFIPTILGKQTHVETRVVTNAEQKNDDTNQFADEAIYIFDAVTNSDLSTAASAIERNDLARVTAGSSGFAECLPSLISFYYQTFPNREPDGSMLVINGSINEVSLEQVIHAEQHGFSVITLAPEILLSEGQSFTDQVEKLVEKVVELSQRDIDVIITSSNESTTQRLVRGADNACQLVAMNLGELTRRILAEATFKFLTVFGGDTLSGVAKHCGWSSLLPRQEILPGVVVSGIPADLQGPLLISKAGGFGEVDVLTQIRSALRSSR